MMKRQRFRPMGVGDILDEAFDIYKSSFTVLVGIGAVLYVPLYAIFGLLMGTSFGNVFGQALNPNPGYPHSHQSSPDPMQIFTMIGGLFVFTLVFAFAQAVLTTAFVRAISQRYLGESTTIGQCYSFIMKRFGAVIGTILLYGLLTFLPFIPMALFAMMAGLASGHGENLGLIAGAVTTGIIGVVIYLMVYFRLIFAPAALIVEDKKYWQAIKRSWNLSAGFGWRIFGIAILTSFIVGIVAQAITGGIMQVVGIGLTVNPQLTMMISMWLQGILQTILAPVMIIVMVLLYYDVRIRKEGFDLEMLARDLTGSTGTTAQTKDQSFADPTTVEPQCAYCKYPVRAGDDAVRCTSCGAVLHTGCWQENRGCSNPVCQSHNQVPDNSQQ